MAAARRNAPPADVNVTYERLPIRCGKRRCRCNTSDQASWHGPYWYAFWNDPKTGRKRSFYIGKHFRAPHAPPRPRGFGERRQPPDEEARARRKAPPSPPPRHGSKLEAAAELLGLASNASQADAKKTWKRLAVENHPDRFTGRERAQREERAKQINAAWDIYRKYRGWT